MSDVRLRVFERTQPARSLCDGIAHAEADLGVTLIDVTDGRSPAYICDSFAAIGYQNPPAGPDTMRTNGLPSAEYSLLMEVRSYAPAATTRGIAITRLARHHFFMMSPPWEGAHGGNAIKAVTTLKAACSRHDFLATEIESRNACVRSEFQPSERREVAVLRRKHGAPT